MPEILKFSVKPDIFVCVCDLVMTGDQMDFIKMELQDISHVGCMPTILVGWHGNPWF